MRTFELGETIAERRVAFEAADGARQDVDIRLGRPVRDGQGEHERWMCPFQIAGLGSHVVRGMFGVDSLQALLHAVHTIPVELAASVRHTGGRLLSFGEPDTTLLFGCRMAIEHAGDVYPEIGEPSS
jgi:hypothetical protein